MQRSQSLRGRRRVHVLLLFTLSTLSNGQEETKTMKKAKDERTPRYCATTMSKYVSIITCT